MVRAKYQHLPDSRADRSLCRLLFNGINAIFLVRRSPLIQLAFGVILGFWMTSTFRRGQSVGHVAEALTVVNSHNISRTDAHDFFLRCIIIIEKRASNPPGFAYALTDGWTKRCNETVFYTNNEKIVKEVKRERDFNAFLIESEGDQLQWEFYKRVVDHATKAPVPWTIVGDHGLLTVVENLRATMATMDANKPIVVGRTLESTSLGSSLLPSSFPPISSRSISVTAGIVFSNSAIDAIFRDCQLQSTALLDLTSAGRALFACAEATNVQVVDPVDEEGYHLFNEESMKSIMKQMHFDDHEGHGKPSCCSEHAVTFGATGFKEQRVSEYATYHMRVFGNEGMHEYIPTTTVEPTTNQAPKTAENSTTVKA